MKKLLMVLLLVVGCVAWGQNSNPQKDCYVQAQKMSSTDISVHNHYDTKTQTCWYETIQYWITGPNNMTPNEPYAWLLVGNVYEKQFKAYFMGPQYGDIEHHISSECFVDDIKCHNLEEFKKLVKQHYPGL